MLVARMESKGPWFDPKVMANTILGVRAVRKKDLSYPSMLAQIGSKLPDHLAITKKIEGPSRQTAYRWERNNPSYPEKALRDGFITKNDLLPWALKQLKSKANMQQIKPSKGSAQDAIGEVLVTLGALGLITRLVSSSRGKRQNACIRGRRRHGVGRWEPLSDFYL